MTTKFFSLAQCGHFKGRACRAGAEAAGNGASQFFWGCLEWVVLKLWGLLYALVCFAAGLLSRIKLPMGSHNPACIDFSEQLLCFSALEGTIHLFN